MQAVSKSKSRASRGRGLVSSWVVTSAALLGACAFAATPPRDPAQVLAEATEDPAALAQLVRSGVTNGGLWFSDAACNAQFGLPGVVADDHLGAFARCLAGLHLQRSPREDQLGDVVVMTYAPGFEVEARVVNELSGPRLTWIGYESLRADGDHLPTISSRAIEALRVAGDRNGPLDADVAATLETHTTEAQAQAHTWIKFCIDEHGAVSAAYPHETTSSNATKAFVAAVRRWSFRPLVIDGTATAACSMARLGYPASAAPAVETIPMPPPPSKGVDAPIMLPAGSTLLMDKRIKGDPQIGPDDQTRIAMDNARLHVVTGSFRLCLDETGHVESIMPIRSTGFADYDRELRGAMQQWLYSPFLVDGQPVPVCTEITFVYNQRGR
jgi:hypothetical protein